MSGLEFRDPAPGPRRPHGTRLARDLKAQPGRWAAVRRGLTANGAFGASWKIRTGYHGWCSPAGTFDAAVRAEDGGYTLFVRYIGDPGAVTE